MLLRSKFYRYVGLLVVLVAVGIFAEWPTIKPMLTGKPLGPAPQLCFPDPEKSRLELPPPDGFHVIGRVNQLPASVLWRFTETNGKRWVIADPGHNFESADLITDETLPRMRLIFAAKSPTETVAAYEQGGFGLSYIIEAFRQDPTDLRPLWRAFCRSKPESLDRLRLLLDSGQCVAESEWRKGFPPCTPRALPSRESR